MPGNPREMITLAERRFPVRLMIAVPPNGLGQRYTQITAWLDENWGSEGWAMTPSGRAACSTMPSRSISLMPPSPARSLPGGASGQRRRLPAVYSKCARMSRSRGWGQGSIARRECGEDSPCALGMVCDGKCSEVMDGAAHYRNKAKRARQLADLAWQPDLQDTLRSLATDYDEIAEDIESGETEIRQAELIGD